MVLLENDLKGISIEALQKAIADAVNKVVHTEAGVKPYECTISAIDFGTFWGAKMRIELRRPINLTDE